MGRKNIRSLVRKASTTAVTLQIRVEYARIWDNMGEKVESKKSSQMGQEL